jgi:hypothetical protein
VTKRLADLVLEDTRRPVSDREHFPGTTRGVPAKREGGRIVETKKALTGELLIRKRTPESVP